jgi:hypothetical protein
MLDPGMSDITMKHTTYITTKGTSDSKPSGHIQHFDVKLYENPSLLRTMRKTMCPIQVAFMTSGSKSDACQQEIVQHTSFLPP